MTKKEFEKILIAERKKNQRILRHIKERHQQFIEELRAAISSF